MKFVNIFIAGAKDLATQRKNLKALIGDINHKIGSQGEKFVLMFHRMKLLEIIKKSMMNILGIKQIWLFLF